MLNMRESWTDERLDDFAKHVDQRFDRVDADFRDLRVEMSNRFGRVEARFDSLQRTLLQLGGGIMVALIGLIATQL